jgi:HPt (histidine-containing phosphotransfer) domain-containing protein/two-component sensor histidine kinase/PAS domain-containing protein
MCAALRFLVLPPAVSAFEARYLARMNRVALGFFAAHLPLFVVIAALNDTGPLLAAVLTAAVLVGPALAVRKCALRTASVVMGVTAMFMGAILVHIGQGPVQIEMHFYFFVLLALLAVFANPMVVVAAAVTAAVHHLALWALLPASMFNYDAPVWVVAVHAAFVVLESVAACYIARSFFDNVVGLEKIIAARTAQLESRTQDMRTLLDAVDQGFFTIDRRGVVSEERSAAVARLLGAGPAGATLPDLIRPHNPAAADWLALGIDDVFADLLPVEVTLDQLPSRMQIGDRTLRLEYTPVPRTGPPTAIAVVLTDVTAAVVRERLESEHRVLMAMAERIGHDKAGFLEFFQEADELVQCLSAETTEDLAVVKRKVHTLKGNAAIFGLEPVAEACHEIETHIADTDTLPAPAAWDAVHARWETCRANLKRLVGEAPNGVMLGDTEYAGILAGVLDRAPRDVLAHQVAAWRLEPTDKRLGRLADQARTLARRLNKGEIEVRTHGGGLRLDAEHWAPFWSAFVHVVRNAVDHGVQPPEERTAGGKSGAGAIDLATAVRDGRFVVSIADDGKGIDWARVAELAAGRGLPAAAPADLVEALFEDGLSTASAVTAVSGRGVGMGAVRAACRDLGGRIDVHSARGVGTRFEFSFPVKSMAPATIDMLGRHGVENPEQVLFVPTAPAAVRPAPEPDNVPQVVA